MPPNAMLSWVTRPRVYTYNILSTFAALLAVGTAFNERSNFYAAVVFLGRSNGCLLILLNFLLVIALVAGRILQLLFFGQLRRSEVELVCERSWYSLVGTLLAVSIFRDDFSVSFVILFGTLLFLKIFHWLSAERVASIMQSPSVPRIFHARMVSILTTLLLADLLLVGFSMQMLLIKKVKVGIMVLFTSEFIILTALLGNTIAQYILNCIDTAREEPWEAKSLYVLYVDLAHDVVRLCTHTYFFILLTRMYGIPLSLIHDLYSTGRSCTMKVKALIRYRQALKKMETKYPNASAADLQSMDGTCIICREDMVAAELESESGTAAASGAGMVTNKTPKKLSCGHIFHFRCLRSWVERQQSCPTCRRMILDDDPEPAPTAQQQQQQQAPQQQQNDAAQSGTTGPAVPSGSDPQQPNTSTANATDLTTHDPTAAEQEYNSRLQGFLSRLQSDLRKVREEGNLSACQASATRRRTSRSGRSTPRGGANGATRLSAAMAGLDFGQSGRHTGLPRNNGWLPPVQGKGWEVNSVEGGLWMPPPPSTLYVDGRRPTLPNGAGPRVAAPAATHSTEEGEGEGKGKAKARDLDPTTPTAPDEGEAESEDPSDPREAIRQATLRRFGQLNFSSSTTTPSVSTTIPASSSHLAASPPIGLIPLFDSNQIANFLSKPASVLPHPLLPASSAPVQPNNAEAALQDKRRGVQEQIALLSGIQARIDSVIGDLTRVLDAVAPTPLPQQTQNEGSSS
ncbi:hypothetical protein NDA18_000759 [Ustilago nuda]|nr:hypothetical protein NDA18_000759 [Ustilago nuda]